METCQRPPGFKGQEPNKFDKRFFFVSFLVTFILIQCIILITICKIYSIFPLNNRYTLWSPVLSLQMSPVPPDGCSCENFDGCYWRRLDVFRPDDGMHHHLNNRLAALDFRFLLIAVLGKSKDNRATERKTHCNYHLFSFFRKVKRGSWRQHDTWWRLFTLAAIPIYCSVQTPGPGGWHSHSLYFCPWPYHRSETFILMFNSHLF